MSIARERIQPLLDDASVSEILINGPRDVFIERSGCIVPVDIVFTGEQEISALAAELLTGPSIKPDANRPYADGRLPDGSRVNIVTPPAAVDGTVITIRKFSHSLRTGESLIEHGMMNRGMFEFLRLCVTAKKNLVICGGTGSGKTTVLNVVGGCIPDTERIITIEDTAEINLPQRHVVRLEGRAGRPDGLGSVTTRNLLINALRMRPDRLLVGECRGGETFDMLQAMNTGHNGSMTTVHANSPRDCLKRIEAMTLMAGIELPVTAVREQIASALNIIIQTGRFPDGMRRITAICEVTGMESGIISLSPVFEYRGGSFAAAGIIPSFVHDMRMTGSDIDLEAFQ